MKKLLIGLRFALKIIGYNPLKTWSLIVGFPFYVRTFFELKRQKGDNNDFSFSYPYPILDQREAKAGVLSGSYFHQDLLVAQRIFDRKPVKHIDIGSRIDGFVAHVASFREIELFDIRPQESRVDNIKFRQADFMATPDDLIDYCDSISTLNAVEHFGLGRYGDPIDYNGHIKAIENMHKVLKTGGIFYFSVPIGNPQRIVFNAHRIFNVAYLLSIFEGKFKLINFSYVDDKGELHQNVDVVKSLADSSYGCRYGLGIFELEKN